MLNYPELVKELKEKDEYIITKLAIYHELTSSVDIEDVLPEDVNKIVEYLYDIYLYNDNMNYLYPKLAETALNICDYELSNFLSLIQENGDEFKKQILTEFYSLCK